MVRIQFTTTIRDGERQEKIGFRAKGKVYEKNGFTYLVFSEPHEAGDIQTTCKIGDGEVRIMRTGHVKMNHLYQLGQVTTSAYNSPIGPMELEATTTKLTVGANELFLSYALTIGGQSAGAYDITLVWS